MLSIFTTDIQKTIFSLTIGFIIYKITQFYVKVFSLPPGPLPVPVLGNILYFWRTKVHWNYDLEKVGKKFGPIFTFWLGMKPTVFITDIDIARHTFRKNDFSGRPDAILARIMSNEKYSDIIFTDCGPKWEALRRVAHSAAQTYSTSDKLVYLVSDCVDQTIDMIIDREGFDKPFNPLEYIYYTFLNILSASAYGKSYDMDDKEYKQIKYTLNQQLLDIGNKIYFWEFFPIYRKFDAKNVNKFNKTFEGMRELIKNQFMSHYRDYSESVIRDFCDALICAKNHAIKEGKHSAPYLTDDNMAMTIFDLFFAGSDTSQGTFRWFLLFMSYYPNIEKKLRQEIESKIGDRIAIQEDINSCHYVMAFMSEILRFRNVAPTGIVHKTMSRTQIGKYTVPEGQEVIVYQSSILNDEKYWSNPDQFIPERFLSNGKYITSRPSAYIPFGVGRRVCLGEKLAINDLFLVLVRFIQKTSEYNIILDSHNGLEPDPDNTDEIYPKQFQLIFKKK